MKIKSILEHVWKFGESKVPDEYGVDRPREFKIYSNPDEKELAELIESSKYNVAGIITSDNNIYIWDRHFASHNRIGIDANDIKIAFYLYPPIFKGEKYHISISGWSTPNVGDDDIEDVRSAINRSIGSQHI